MTLNVLYNEFMKTSKARGAQPGPQSHWVEESLVYTDGFMWPSINATIK